MNKLISDIACNAATPLWLYEGGKIAAQYDTSAQGEVPGERGNEKDWRFFETLMRNVEPQPFYSVVDAGCGTGDFLEYARKREMNITMYSGLDVSQRLLDFAIARWGSHANQMFSRVNIVNPLLGSDTHTLVLAQGSLISRTSHYELYVRHCLTRMAALSGKYVLASFITRILDYTNYPNSDQVGHVTSIPRVTLEIILDDLRKYGRISRWHIQEESFYPDAVDAFVHAEV